MRLRLNTVPISDHRDRSTRVPCLVGSIPRSHTSSRTTSLGADHSLRRLLLWAALLAAVVFIELRMKTSSEKLNRNSDDVGMVCRRCRLRAIEACYWRGSASVSETMSFG